METSTNTIRQALAPLRKLVGLLRALLQFLLMSILKAYRYFISPMMGHTVDLNPPAPSTPSTQSTLTVLYAAVF